MDLLEFFSPVPTEPYEHEVFPNTSWYHALDIHTKRQKPDWRHKKLVLIGITGNEILERNAAEVRRYLYRLARPEYAEDLVDIGNYEWRGRDADYQSLAFVLSELAGYELIPVLMNGPHELAYAQYLSFCYMKRFVNFVNIDARIDFSLSEDEQRVSSPNFIQRILLEDPAYLFGYTHIGYQTHFANSDEMDFLEKLHFELVRLADVRANMQMAEPLLRTAHFMSADLAAVRQSDAPGALMPTPNGFFGEEACLLSRYTGLGHNLRCAGFFNHHGNTEINGQTVHLAAQMVWYLVDGWMNRQPEHPFDHQDDFQKYITPVQQNGYEILFYKSKRTGRWWMSVPISREDYGTSQHLLPCSYDDYLAATQGEIPDRWWHALQKLG